MPTYMLHLPASKQDEETVTSYIVVQQILYSTKELIHLRDFFGHLYTVVMVQKQTVCSNLPERCFKTMALLLLVKNMIVRLEWCFLMDIISSGTVFISVCLCVWSLRH